MDRRFRMGLSVVLVLALSLALVSGCGGGGTTTPPPAEEEKPAIRAGLVTDIGGKGDKSFNDSSIAGLERARDELGVEIQDISSKAAADYDSNLAQLGNAGFDIVFGVGFLMTDALSKAATDFPDVKFAGIDVFNAGSQPNQVGLSFKEQEAGYLSGVVAGLLTKDTAADDRINADNVIGFVGGMPIPPVKKFEAGFIAGAKSVNPDVKVISLYCGATPAAFTDQAKGKELGLSLISQKCDIVFAAAGQSGIGTFAACKEKKALFIGVDQDQYNTLPTPGDTIVTSAVKRVDNAVFDTVKAVVDGAYEPGNKTFGLVEEGVDLAPFHEFEPKVSQAIKDAVEKAKQDIISGTVVVPEDPAKA